MTGFNLGSVGPPSLKRNLHQDQNFYTGRLPLFFLHVTKHNFAIGQCQFRVFYSTYYTCR